MKRRDDERRKVYSLDYFDYGGLERRDYSDRRKKRKKRRQAQALFT
jgi:hypothetical protein